MIIDKISSPVMILVATASPKNVTTALRLTTAMTSGERLRYSTRLIASWIANASPVKPQNWKADHER